MDIKFNNAKPMIIKAIIAEDRFLNFVGLIIDIQELLTTFSVWQVGQ